MANIEIKATATIIKVEFNDLSTNPNINSLYATFKRSALSELWHNFDPMPHIRLSMQNGREWNLNLTGGDGIFPVTSIDSGDGVITPTTIEELNTELNKLFI